MDIGDIISDSIKYPILKLDKGTYFGNYNDSYHSDCTNFFSIRIYFRIIKATLAGIDELP